MTKQKAQIIDAELLEGLFEGASRFYKLRPWEIMGDAELFGVQNPDTREIAPRSADREFRESGLTLSGR